MDRREFIKASGIAVVSVATGFGGFKSVLPKPPSGVPSKYRGFDISIDIINRSGKVSHKQFYATNGKHHISVAFDLDTSDAEIWELYKNDMHGLDFAIDKYEAYTRNSSRKAADRLGYVPAT